MKKILHMCACLLAALLVLVLPILVRAPAARLIDTPQDLRPEFMNDSGQIYMMEMDSYYHTRLMDNYMKYGSLGDSVSENGKSWDTVSHYPEGRTAEYQPGIIYLTTAVWKVLNRLTGVSLYSVELWISTFMAALSGFIAFLFVRRISNTAGGFVAGILVSCQPVFVERTLPGRFDTDMFIVLMDVLLIFLFAEALKADSARTRWASFAGFVLTAYIYSMCWSHNSVLLAVLTAAGGFVYLLILFFRNAVGQSEVRMFLVCTCLAAAVILVAKGPNYLIGAIRNALSFNAAGQSNADPDIFSSIVELAAPAIFPQKFTQSFLSYIPGHQHTVLNGIGGLPVVVLAMGGLLMLVLHAVQSGKAVQGKADGALSARRKNALYFCILIVWTAGCFLATLRGVRFIEHLAVPVSLAAGMFVGWIVPAESIPAENISAENISADDISAGTEKWFLKQTAVCIAGVLICFTAVILPLSGALSISRYVQPAVTDASARAMAWIKENAENPDAVIASWWDMGYYYEDASGHPAFWDGGSQNGTRAILISRALTSHYPEESCRILQMLASEGDWPADWLKKQLGGNKAFEALWRIFPLEKKETIDLLTNEYGLDQSQAAVIERKVHPAEEKEIYLVLTRSMMDMLGWFEYYAGWDFEGGNTKPYATVHYVKADGTEIMDSAHMQEYFQNRSQETIWRLFLDNGVLNNGEKQSVFTKVYETSDPFQEVQIWKM